MCGCVIRGMYVPPVCLLRVAKGRTLWAIPLVVAGPFAFLDEASSPARTHECGRDRVRQDISPAGGDVAVRPEDVAGGCAGGPVAGAGDCIGHHQGLERQRGVASHRLHAHERIAPLAFGAEPYAGEAAVESGKEPASAERRVERRCPGARWGTVTGRETVRSVEWGSIVGGGDREAAGIDEAPRERLAGGQRQHAVAEEAAGRALGRYEIGRAGGVEQVLIGSWNSFRIVAVEQMLRSQGAQHEVELPDEVVGVLHSAVAATRAERRHLMRGIARE